MSGAAFTALAPAKLNLGLFVGPVRDGDGRHELVSVMQSLSLADTLTLRPDPEGGGHDRVICPGLADPPGGNLAGVALAAFRAATGWDAPALLLEIEKRIPVAAGLGGGSADAAATLRLAQAASGHGDEELLLVLAAQLGADVPSQVNPGRWLAGGAGERLEPLPLPKAGLAVLLLPSAEELSTAAVYAEADRLGSVRTADQLADLRERLHGALGRGEALPQGDDLLFNDLQPAAVSLQPRIAETLAEAAGAGAGDVFVSGSGPTVAAVFADTHDAPAGVAASAVAERLADRRPAPLLARPAGPAFAAPTELGL